MEHVSCISKCSSARFSARGQVVGSAIIRLSLSPSRTKLVRGPASCVFPELRIGFTI